MTMYLQNNYCKWATISKMAPIQIQTETKKFVSTKSAVGIIKIGSTNSNVSFGNNNNLMSTIIITTDDEIQEYYGVVLFNTIADEKSMTWREQVDRFVAHPSSFELMHPKVISEGKSYIFFANRSVITKRKDTRKQWKKE